MGKLDATITAWGSSETIYRVHPDIYRPDEFNPTNLGDARFSPLVNSSGAVIPTLYAGTTLDCALMETVFHDVPCIAGVKIHSKAKHVSGRSHSSLRLPRDLMLIDLTTIPLRRLGISRSDLIDTDASEYSETRKWGLALYEQFPNAEGLMWTSRQDDTAKAFVLFGDRLRGLALELVAGPTSLLLADGSACSEVIHLASRLGVLVT